MSSPCTGSDTELVGKLLDGDEASFTALVRKHHASMLRVAMVFVRSRAVAEEVVQEAWIGLLSGLSRFEGRSSLKTWLFRIVVNRAKTRSQRERRSMPFSSLESSTGELGEAIDPTRFTTRGMWASPTQTWGQSTPEQHVLRSEALEEVQQALAELPPLQQTVVRLRDVEGWSSQEVCDLLELSSVNQRVLLHRGRTKIRNIIGGQCHKAMLIERFRNRALLSATSAVKPARTPKRGSRIGGVQ